MKRIPPKNEASATWNECFESNLTMRMRLERATMQVRLEDKSDQMWSPVEMERAGGQPDDGSPPQSNRFGWLGQLPPKIVAKIQ